MKVTRSFVYSPLICLLAVFSWGCSNQCPVHELVESDAANDLYNIEERILNLKGEKDDFRIRINLPQEWKEAIIPEGKFEGSMEVLFQTHQSLRRGLPWSMAIFTQRTANSELISETDQYWMCSVIQEIGFGGKEQEEWVSKITGMPFTSLNPLRLAKIESNGEELYGMYRQGVFDVAGVKRYAGQDKFMSNWKVSFVHDGAWLHVEIKTYDDLPVAIESAFAEAILSSIQVLD